jgi:hypothetical protein
LGALHQHRAAPWGGCLVDFSDVCRTVPPGVLARGPAGVLVDNVDWLESRWLCHSSTASLLLCSLLHFLRCFASSVYDVTHIIGKPAMHRLARPQVTIGLPIRDLFALIHVKQS